MEPNFSVSVRFGSGSRFFRFGFQFFVPRVISNRAVPNQPTNQIPGKAFAPAKYRDQTTNQESRNQPSKPSKETNRRKARGHRTFRSWTTWINSMETVDREAEQEYPAGHGEIPCICSTATATLPRGM